MKLLSLFSFLLTLLSISPLVSSMKLIESKALIPCQDNSNFTATLFNVVFTPHNRSANVELVAVSSISGNVTAELELYAYGFQALKESLNPCDLDLKGLCPMNTGPFNLDSNFMDISDSVIDKVPGIAYDVPDLDAKVRVYIKSVDTGDSIACLETRLSNGKTVYHKAVGWVVAVIAGLGLVVSAIASGLGHSSTAAHVAANALSLFGFFQAQAMIGMTSVTLPPIVQSWTQNFQWSMGIIRVSFLQRLCTWYQRSTGGEPTAILTSLSTTSVQVHKRSVEFVQNLMGSGTEELAKRSNNENLVGESTKTTIVRGISRVGFRAGIEKTNIFMTGLIFFVCFVAFVMLGVVLFKVGCELAAKKGMMKSNKFHDFRHGWKIVMRGILFRLTLIGFPQMTILCLWELTQQDSAAEVVLAVFLLLAILGSLGWAAWKVIQLAKRSVEMHKNAAYILYSDPTSLNKWGFLYVQYRATAYYCVVPVLIYILVKSMFIGLAQEAPVVQAIALLILELAVLAGVCYLKPWMDKKTNIFNISIIAVNFFNVILLMFFTQIFKQPGMVTGVMGVIFFVVNAAFALVLLILVLIASVYAIISKNPDTRYQPMRDDRGSFIKSQTQLTTELDALGATARDEGKSRDLDDDRNSLSAYPSSRMQQDTSDGFTRPNNAHQNSHSPVDPAVPLFPMAESRPSPGPQPFESQGMFNNSNDMYGRSQNASPVQRGLTTSPYSRSGTANSHQQYRAQNSGSPWQRGAGYD